MKFTIAELLELTKQNVREVQRIGTEYRRKGDARFERVETLCKHHDEVFHLLNRRSLPRKSEMERLMKMSRNLLDKVCKL